MLLAFLSEMSATCICLLYFITEFWNKQPRVKKKKEWNAARAYVGVGQGEASWGQQQEPIA